LTTVEPWSKFYPYLVQLPGFGLVVSMTVLAAIGDVTRFSTSKLLVVVWHVLTEREADRRADPDMVAFKPMLWSWKLGKEQRGGLTTPQFMRPGLTRLEMGEDLGHIVRGGTVRPIASVEEVRALQTEITAQPSSITRAQPATTEQDQCLPPFEKARTARRGGYCSAQPSVRRFLFSRYKCLTNQLIGRRAPLYEHTSIHIPVPSLCASPTS
jgi:hypothetical protein